MAVVKVVTFIARHPFTILIWSAVVAMTGCYLLPSPKAKLYCGAVLLVAISAFWVLYALGIKKLSRH